MPGGSEPGSDSQFAQPVAQAPVDEGRQDVAHRGVARLDLVALVGGAGARFEQRAMPLAALVPGRGVVIERDRHARIAVGLATVAGLPCQDSDVVLKQTMRLNRGTKLLTMPVMFLSQISKDPPQSSCQSLLR